jgi:hypothetical protein
MKYIKEFIHGSLRFFHGLTWISFKLRKVTTPVKKFPDLNYFWYVYEFTDPSPWQEHQGPWSLPSGPRSHQPEADIRKSTRSSRTADHTVLDGGSSFIMTVISDWKGANVTRTQ